MRPLITGVLSLLVLVSCVRVSPEVAVRRQIYAMNTCAYDSDCAAVPGKCPFDCYVLTNKYNIDRVQSLLASFESTCTLTCADPGPVLCDGRQCVFDDNVPDVDRATWATMQCGTLRRRLELIGERGEKFCESVGDRILDRAVPRWVVGTLQSVTSRRMSAPFESYIEYTFHFQGEERTVKVVSFSEQEMEFNVGEPYTFDYRNACRQRHLTSGERVPRSFLESFTLPVSVACPAQ